VRILSLGAGVQSTTLYLMACVGDLSPAPDHAIFADTGWEPRAVYRHLEWLRSQAFGIPISIVSKGNIRDDLVTAVKDRRFATMPFHVRNEDGRAAMLRRQCTREYKVEPITREIRRLLGVPKGARVQAAVEQWFGISLDEAARMRDSRYPWITNRYPLIEMRMRRSDCLRWLKDQAFPRPAKSACIGCPFHDNATWREMKRDRAEEWTDAVAFDRLIRGGLRGVKCEAFLHRSLRPLDQVELNGDQRQHQFAFVDECEGMCGT